MAEASRLPRGVGPGTVIGQHYRIVRVIGEGGMGVVFEAEGPNGQHVALKLLIETQGNVPSDEARARFMRESNVSLNLRAAHVVAVHDHGVDVATNLPFMVMDLLEGEDLEKVVARAGPLDPQVAVKIFLQACEGLEAAHDMGVVHRDVKPSNIFLCRIPGGRADVRICDFGAAKIFGGQQLTHAGTVVGTPLYIAPEQLRSSRDADARADVWSLGMSLYFALAGKPALDHVRSFVQLVQTLSAGDIPHLQKIAPWVPPQLTRVVHGTLIAKVDARCPSVKELAAALLKCNAGDDAVVTAALVPLEASMRAHTYEPVPLPAHWNDVMVTMPTDPPSTLEVTLSGAPTERAPSVTVQAANPQAASGPRPRGAMATLPPTPPPKASPMRVVVALAVLLVFAIGIASLVLMR